MADVSHGGVIVIVAIVIITVNSIVCIHNDAMTDFSCDDDVPVVRASARLHNMAPVVPWAYELRI